MEYFNRFCSILIFAVFPRIVLSVPHEFCLDTFDDGDCGDPPQSVFYYYKPGSRCEIRTWRGCPTLNKFADHFSCSHFCIGRIWGDSIEIFDSEEIKEPLNVTEVENANTVWVEEVKDLEIDDVEAIDDILDHVAEEEEQEEQATDSESSFVLVEQEVVVLP